MNHAAWAEFAAALDRRGRADPHRCDQSCEGSDMSTFRKGYRELSCEEHEHIERIKDIAQSLEELIRAGLEYDHDTLTERDNQRRHISLAMTNLEQAVMWAVKAYT